MTPDNDGNKNDEDHQINLGEMMIYEREPTSLMKLKLPKQLKHCKTTLFMLMKTEVQIPLPVSPLWNVMQSKNVTHT